MKKATAMTSKKLRVALEEAGLSPDKIKKVGDKFEVMSGFFYRHGRSSEKWAKRVQEALKRAKINVQVVDDREDWRSWPRDSYFVAICMET